MPAMVVSVPLLLFILQIFCTGCREAPGEIYPADTVQSALLLAPLVTDFGGAQPANVLSVARLSSPVMTGGQVTNVTFAAARFGSPAHDEGTVTAIAITTYYLLMKQPDNTYTYLPSSRFPDGIVLNHHDTPVTFDVGHLFLPDSIIEVPGELRITAPLAGALVPRTGPLSVAWTTIGTARLSEVYVTDANGSVRARGNTDSVFAETFAAGELSGLAPGSSLVFAVMYRYELMNSDSTALLGESAAYVPVTLQ